MFNLVCSLETAVMCGQPPQVPYGKVEGADFHWGASISYSCVDGFQPSHSAILSCEGHGVWKGEVPQCLRKSSSNVRFWGPAALDTCEPNQLPVIASHTAGGRGSHLRLPCSRQVDGFNSYTQRFFRCSLHKVEGQPDPAVRTVS